MSDPDPILILGIGNYLMGDEGVGVHAIRHLEKRSFPAHVHLLDGGTGGFHLISHLESYPFIIMIDATMDGNPPGTLRVIKPRFASDFPRSLTAHDIGLRDLVESMALLGRFPRITLITVSIEEIQSMSTELSSSLQKSLPQITDTVLEILNARQGQ
ncbi:MAG: HyaD/HybD family hydrogenase maturation endopeptidase [Acidobacteriia bacterium]|nr:HyaD/HybD family hydrogenase maturation endopeptidase [Terriglobia bacterium]